MEERLVQKREQFRVSIRRKHKNKTLGQRRCCLLQYMEEQEQVISEDNFIDLCHELIRSYLKGDATLIDEVMQGIHRVRLLVERPRIMLEIKTIELEQFLFGLLEKESMSEFLPETAISALDVLLEMSMTGIADGELAMRDNLVVLVDLLEEGLNSIDKPFWRSIVERVMIIFGNLLTGSTKQIYAVLNELPLEVLLSNYLGSGSTEIPQRCFCHLLLKYIDSFGINLRVDFLRMAEHCLKEIYLSELRRSDFEDSLLLELENYLSKLMYNTNRQIDITVIQEMFQHKSIGALEALVRISELNQVTISTCDFAEDIFSGLHNPELNEYIKVQMLRLLTNMLINSADDDGQQQLFTQVVNLQGLYYNTQSLAVRAEYAYLFKCMAYMAPTFVFSQAMPVIQEIMTDRWTDTNITESIKQSLNNWFRGVDDDSLLNSFSDVALSEPYLHD